MFNFFFKTNLFTFFGIILKFVLAETVTTFNKTLGTLPLFQLFKSGLNTAVIFVFKHMTVLTVSSSYLFIDVVYVELGLIDSLYFLNVLFNYNVLSCLFSYFLFANIVNALTNTVN